MGDHQVTIVIATFGDGRWQDMARERALPSAQQQPAHIQMVHDTSLAAARNRGASLVMTEWVVFLDADDELEPGYVDALLAADGELRAPSIRFVRDGVPGEVESLAQRDINRTNPCVIGTMLRVKLFDKAGGFWPERAWEDWSLFRRCVLLGARITHTPEAVYRIHESPNGRNSTVAEPRSLHREILSSHDRWMRSRR